MATLTGFKQVGESAAAGAAANGQQNPVFVFDEVDVGDGQSVSNDEFVDAPEVAPAAAAAANEVASSNGNSKATPAQKQQVQSKTTNSKTTSGPHAVAIEIVSVDTSQDQQQQQTEINNTNRTTSTANNNNTTTTDQQSEAPQSTTPPGAGQQRKAAAAKSATGAQLQKGTANSTTTTTTTTTTGRQQRHQQHQQNQLNNPMSQANNCLSPNDTGNEGDNVSVSMLAIDCVGTGKSPRTPRRSPLMALFRGKPRESVRRMYTDEDQFQIEWADLSLEFQKKWYQKYSLSSLLMGGGGGGGGGGGQEAKGGQRLEKPKLILKGVDGRIKSGEITAVLGPSGAGKTSLLNSLFGKYRTMIQGSIKVTGAPSKKHLTVCTIPQNDYLIGYLTTEEALWFASRLKNTEDDFNHDRNIERVIELLGLQRCRQTRINKLSGGQYKRVSIAQEMLSSPDILVLDEPTSGLDSLTCYRTVKVLRDLVEASKAHNLVNPMSIILTIHQPHREVLDLFHSVYVMAVGGQTLFQGAPGEMEEVINKHSGTSMPTVGYNPASFMVEVASEEYGRKPIEMLVENQRKRFKASTKHQYTFRNYDGDQQVMDHLAGSQQSLYSSNNNNKDGSTITLYPLDGGNKNNNYVDIDLSNNKRDATSTGGVRDIDSRVMTPRSGKNSDGVFWRHVNLMSKRCFLSNTRDPLLCTIRVGAHIFIPLVVALIYGPKMGIPNGCPFYKPEINLLEYASMGVEEIQEKHDDIRIQFQNVGLHFMVYYAFGLCMLAFTAISFPLIMHVLIKEIRNGWYSLAAFIIGKMFAELPMALVLPPISVGIIYLMTGQPSSYLEWRYMVQSLILILVVMIAEAKGLIFGAICMNSMQTAVFAASVSTVPFILLSGFLIRIREVPYVLQHFARFSYFKHSVEALIITRYGFGMCPCDPALIPAGGTPRIIGIPAQIMSLTDYYINSYVEGPAANSTEAADETNVVGNNRSISKIVDSITTLRPEISDSAAADEPPTETESSAVDGSPPADRRARRAAATSGARSKSTTTTTTTVATTTAEAEEPEAAPVKQGIFFDKLATLLTRANAFGYSIQSCADVEPFTMKDMMLTDDMLAPTIGYLFLSIVVLKLISYFIVEICVKLKL